MFNLCMYVFCVLYDFVWFYFFVILAYHSFCLPLSNSSSGCHALSYIAVLFLVIVAKLLACIICPSNRKYM